MDSLQEVVLQFLLVGAIDGNDCEAHGCDLSLQGHEIEEVDDGLNFNGVFLACLSEEGEQLLLDSALHQLGVG